MEQHPLERAVAMAGSQAELGRLTGVSQQRISDWLRNNKPVPAEDAVKIENGLGGKITREELRPDLFSDSHQAA